MIVFALLDQLRRRFGTALDGLGFGPCGHLARTVRSEEAWCLTAGGPVDLGGTPCVLIPAPIKQAYIFDLAPGVSIVRHCLAAGLAPYLLHWNWPRCSEDDGLAAYADRWLLAAVDAVRAETAADRVVLVGHSLGGTLAAIFAALHPDRVAALVLLEAPLHFGADALTRLAVASPSLRPDALACAVPGSYLDMASGWAAPRTFVAEPALDWLASLAAGPEAVQLHLAVRRWTLDELPMPGRLFADVVERLYRRDAFMRGTLHIGGEAALPRHVRAPVLGVIQPGSEIVPSTAVLPFLAAVGSAERGVLEYHGETGVSLQHVGVLVGPSAHRVLWPAILRWIQTHAARG